MGDVCDVERRHARQRTGSAEQKGPGGAAVAPPRRDGGGPPRSRHRRRGDHHPNEKRSRSAAVAAAPVGTTASSSTAAAKPVADVASFFAHAAAGVAEAAAAVPPSVLAPGSAKKAQPTRCAACYKKVGLTGFVCRCKKTFCGSHRYAEEHGCSFDFTAAGRDAIARSNPLVKGEKLRGMI